MISCCRRGRCGASSGGEVWQTLCRGFAPNWWLVGRPRAGGVVVAHRLLWQMPSRLLLNRSAEICIAGTGFSADTARASSKSSPLLDGRGLARALRWIRNVIREATRRCSRGYGVRGWIRSTATGTRRGNTTTTSRSSATTTLGILSSYSPVRSNRPTTAHYMTTPSPGAACAPVRDRSGAGSEAVSVHTG